VPELYGHLNLIGRITAAEGPSCLRRILEGEDEDA